MQNFNQGDRVLHLRMGRGTVIEQRENGVLVVEMDSGGRKIFDLKYARFALVTEEIDDAFKPGSPAYQEWIQNSFEFEGPEAKHYLGSHWSPFFDSTDEMLKKLPEILPEARLQVSYSENNPSQRKVPEEWPRVVYLVWPLRVNGFSIALKITDKANLVVSIFPFDAEGVAHRLILNKVYVWKEGAEAQIECNYGMASITFFDTLYCANRAWYEAGKTYWFILTGFAYSCAKADDHIFQALNPKHLEDCKKNYPAEAAQWPDGDTIPVHTKGMGAFLPILEWDRDDYWFHGTVKSIKEMTILEQPAWKIRTTVIRKTMDTEDFDIDIVVTKKIWGDHEPPQIGDDITGRLWLQGYLWRRNVVEECYEDFSMHFK